ncbi:MAG: zinc ribbon domain-containing protein [Saccharofermentanales bacterium]
MFCTNCGKQLPDGSRFCTACGTDLGRKAGQTDPIPPIPQRIPPVQAASAHGQEPQNTIGLIRYIAKKLPGQLLKALPVTIIVGVVSWLVHTYLLVKVNEGFNPDIWLAQNFLNVKGGFFSSTILWALLGGLISMTVSAVIHGRNPFKSFAGMVKIPGNILKKTGR